MRTALQCWRNTRRAEGNFAAIEHIANRFDGKVHEQVEVTRNTNVKVRYESYEEARALRC
jgi:hypothetical protein